MDPLTLAIRVIGTLLIDGRAGQLVHRERFKTLYPRNPPVTQARIYAARQMDEILMLDVTATEQGREPDYDLIAEVVGETFLPVSYGGGITLVEQARRIVSKCGADKVVLGTRWDLIGPIGQMLGAQAVVVAIDAGRYNDVGDRSEEETAMAAIVARHAETIGAGEILLQSVERDGTLTGYDLDLIRAVSQAVSIPVIASSGCGSPTDMLAAMRAGASAVAAGWMWDATDVTPMDCKAALEQAGYTVRPPERPYAIRR